MAVSIGLDYGTQLRRRLQIGLGHLYIVSHRIKIDFGPRTTLNMHPLDPLALR